MNNVAIIRDYDLATFSEVEDTILEAAVAVSRIRIPCDGFDPAATPGQLEYLRARIVEINRELATKMHDFSVYHDGALSGNRIVSDAEIRAFVARRRAEGYRGDC